MNEISTVIIGGGNMGQAIARGLYNSEMNIAIKTPFPHETLDAFAGNYLNISVSIEAREFSPSERNYAVLAVKPQIFFDVLKENEEFLKSIPNLTIVSVAAGIAFEDIQKNLPYAKIIRSMPNTPVAIGQGLVGYYAKEKETKFEEDFSPLGKIIYLPEEEKIHYFTAVAGSGPAYVFHLMEAMSSAMQENGFSEAESLTIVKQLFLGSSHLADGTLTPTKLRENVTSPKGTTYEGLLKLMNLSELSPQSSQMKAIFEEVFKAASDRSVELAKG